MNRRILLTVTLLALMLLPAGLVAASDISGALYRVVVTVGNSSTAATNVATVCTLSTPNLITGGYANSTVSNIALRSSSGGDIPFMPGWSTNPMALWVPSIGASSYVQDVLYLANSSGGDIKYFPGATGMAVSDNASLEPGANYAFDIDGYIDTTASSSIIYKGASLLTTTGTGIASIGATKDTTGAGVGSADNVYITRYWAQTFTTTSAYSIYGVTFTPFTAGGAAPEVLTVSLHAVDGASKPTGAALATVDLPVSGSPVSSATFTTPAALANATMYAIRFTHAAGPAGASVWAFSYGADTYAAGKLWMSNDGAGTWNEQAGDLLLTAKGPSVSYTCAAGEYAIRWSDNTTHQALYVDPSGTAPGTTLVTSTPDTLGIANNGSAWAFCYAAATPYVSYMKMTIGGTPLTYWDWEYAATFTDNISSVVATPTFRTTTSDADVTASASNFLIIDPGEASASGLVDPDDWYASENITSASFSTGTVTPSFPGSQVITDIASATSTPASLPFTIIGGVFILVVSLSVSRLLRLGGSGSLIVKSVLIAGMMGVLIATSVWDLWMVIVFIVYAIAISMASQQRGWGA